MKTQRNVYMQKPIRGRSNKAIPTMNYSNGGIYEPLWDKTERERKEALRKAWKCIQKEKTLEYLKEL
jgi:hypothetical protein